MLLARLFEPDFFLNNFRKTPVTILTGDLRIPVKGISIRVVLIK